MDIDLMEPLVGVVHSQLLISILIEHLESIDIQQLQVVKVGLLLGFRNAESSVQSIDYPQEQGLVYHLADAVPGLLAFSFVLGRIELLLSCLTLVEHYGFLQVRWHNTQEITDTLQVFVVSHRTWGSSFLL